MIFVILYGQRKNRMKFRTDSLGSWSWGITEEYKLVFGESGAMHFSVTKRMLTFRLTI